MQPPRLDLMWSERKRKVQFPFSQCVCPLSLRVSGTILSCHSKWNSFRDTKCFSIMAIKLQALSFSQWAWRAIDSMKDKSSYVSCLQRLETTSSVPMDGTPLRRPHRCASAAAASSFGLTTEYTQVEADSELCKTSVQDQDGFMCNRWLLNIGTFNRHKQNIESKMHSLRN